MFSRQASKRFAEEVPPNSTVETTTKIDEPATVEQIQIRFYQGPELDLALLPYRERQGDKVPLVDLYGREQIVGDNDTFVFPISEQLHSDDVLGVEATNSNPEYSYDFSVDMTVDRAGGIDRALSSLTGVL